MLQRVGGALCMHQRYICVGLCLVVDFEPHTAEVKASRGDLLRLYILNDRRSVGALGWYWFGREVALKIGWFCSVMVV